MTTPSGFGGDGDLERLKSVIARWRTSLVDLSGRNRLLNFRHTQAATLEITHPSAEELVLGLERGWDFAALPDEEPGEGAASAGSETGKRQGVATQKTTGPSLYRALANLRRRSTQVFNDYGIWTLQLGVGMLNWREDGAEVGSDAPLVLIPVVLERMANGRIRLVLSEDEEPKINPALPVKLEQLYVDWSPVSEQDPNDLTAVFEAAASCIAGKSNWSISERVVLALFASHKESMYQDLLENEAKVIGSDLVKALALGPAAKLAADRFDFEEIELDRIDELSPPEETPLVLDADASQRQAIAAAVARQSFVMDGPPGTGKSQTITNMIAALIHAGRSVLFVSEKAAALDVVLDRLKSVGLDSYALAIHSNSTSRSAVAKELGRALDEQPDAPRLPHDTKEDVRRAREALTGYAEAMNEVRDPLGRTLHDVIGRVASLSDAAIAYTDPAARGDAFRVESLASRDLTVIIDATEVIARCWVAIADPQFPWRNVRRDAVNVRPTLDQAHAAIRVLIDAAHHYRERTGGVLALRDEDDVEHLLGMLDLVKARARVPQWWLTTGNFVDDVEARVDRYLFELEDVGAALKDASAVGGVHWRDLPARLSAESTESERALQSLVPPALELRGLTEHEARNTALAFRELAERLEANHLRITSLSNALGLANPSGTRDAEIVCEVAALAQSAHRPLAQWFSSAQLAEARTAAVSLTAARLRDLLARRARTLQAIGAASALAGRNWDQLDRSIETVPPVSETALVELRPSGLDLERWNRKQLGRFAESFSELADSLAAADDLASALASRLGCPEPGSVDEVTVVVDLIECSAIQNRALLEWFDASILAQVQEATREIGDAVDRLHVAQTKARGVFLPSIVDLPDLPDVTARLLEAPRGFGALFSRRVRADRRTIAAHSDGGTWRAELYETLPLAGEWYRAYHELRNLCEAKSELLGRFVNPATVEVDSDALESALEHARAIHSLAPGLLADPKIKSKLGEQLADGGELAEDLINEGRRLRALLRAWTDLLALPELVERAGELSAVSLGRAAYWVQAHRAPLELACELTDKVTSTIGRFSADTSEHTLGSVRKATASARIAQDMVVEYQKAELVDRKLLGSSYQGLETTLESVEMSVAGHERASTAAGRMIISAIEVLRDRFDVDIAAEQVALLGCYAPDGNPDTEALSEALEVAATIETLAPDALVDPPRQHKLVAALADGQMSDDTLQARALEVLDGVQDWEQSVAQLGLDSSGAALLTVTAEDAATWLRAHLQPLAEAAELIRTVTRVVGEVPAPTLTSARSAVAAALKARQLEEAFEGGRETHRSVLGSLENGLDTVPAQVRTAMQWARSVRRVVNRGVSAALDERVAEMMLESAPDDSLRIYFEDWKRQCAAILDCFRPKRRSELKGEIARSLADAESVLDLLVADPFGPEMWIESRDALATLDKYRLGDLPAQLAQRGVSDEHFPAAVERAVLVAWTEHQLAVDRRLLPHKGVDRDGIVERFQELDRELVEAAHADVIAACNARRPRKTTVGQAAIIRREAVKQRRHMPVRHLLDETRDVVRLLKPCFMMSPLTVSQFLSSDYRFDVVIFDEASQVLPQDAVNSIYRGDALIVAGDPRQLPPTAFFNATNDTNEEDEWDEDEPSFESVLDSCKATGILRSLPLRWHYRSRHEHLIAFSNREFYDNAMVTFPGALEDGHDIGVQFFKVDGVYDRGGRRDNRIEAEYVAQRVIHHFETRPSLTLGVVALSKSQAEAIEEAVDKARQARPSLAKFFTENRLDGFFVKNLETVQGDERDVIVLSVGYGRDAQGRLRSEFGPINREAGWRRLNVAVTRARRRMEVVASFRGSELPDSANKSVQHLKRYLEYAEHGPRVLATQVVDPDAAPESPFEESVLKVLKGWGYSVQPQVGVAGYRIDMAIRHPDAPGAFALGIECDGAMYHSSKAARDRDRLREAVLRDLGWKLHRIWGTDWYRDRNEAMRRLRAAVEAACAVDLHAGYIGPTAGEVQGEPTSLGGESELSPTPVTRTVEFVPVEDSAAVWAQEYRHLSDNDLWETRQQARRSWADLQEVDSTDAIVAVVLKVLEREGPIVEELVITRVRSAWLLAKSGPVIQRRVRSVLDSLVRKKRVVKVGTAYDLPDREITAARMPTDYCQRKVGHVPGIERQFAMSRVVEDCPGISRNELFREVGRVFGWSRIRSEIRAALTQDLEELLRMKTFVETGGGIRPAMSR